MDKKTTEPKVSMIVFSGDLDKVLASFVIATGSVAMGMEVVMFFTFWGLKVIQKGGAEKAKLSNMNMGGLGKMMIKKMMKKKNEEVFVIIHED